MPLDYLLKTLGQDNPLKTHFPSTIGDDKTDKDAFQVIDFIMKNACD